MDKKKGSKALLKRLEKLNIRHHIFGHIHEEYGSLTEKDLKFTNCSLLDDNYKTKNQPAVIEIEQKN